MQTPTWIQRIFSSLVWRIPTQEKVIYLTFDDGPDPRWTPRVLDILARAGATATFFVVGKLARARPDLVRRIASYFRPRSGRMVAVAATIAAGSVAGTHAYNAAGIYTLRLTVTDDDSGAAATLFQYVVVYDPEGGFVTGGGWIISPPGAAIEASCPFCGS